MTAPSESLPQRLRQLAGYMDGTAAMYRPEIAILRIAAGELEALAAEKDFFKEACAKLEADLKLKGDALEKAEAELSVLRAENRELKYGLSVGEKGGAAE